MEGLEQMSEISSCQNPECNGGEERISTLYIPCRKSFAVECGKCMMRGPAYDSEEEAIAGWDALSWVDDGKQPSTKDDEGKELFTFDDLHRIETLHRILGKILERFLDED
jgi:hypothetical protein